MIIEELQNNASKQRITDSFIGHKSFFCNFPNIGFLHVLTEQQHQYFLETTGTKSSYSSFLMPI